MHPKPTINFVGNSLDPIGLCQMFSFFDSNIVSSQDSQLACYIIIRVCYSRVIPQGNPRIGFRKPLRHRVANTIRGTCYDSHLAGHLELLQDIAWCVRERPREPLASLSAVRYGHRHLVRQGRSCSWNNQIQLAS